VTKEMLRRIGARPGALQIVPLRSMVRPACLHEEDRALSTLPLASPTGPGGAKGFRNRAGSQIATPAVTNIYLGPFWADRAFVEGFSKAIVENGYLDPLKELHYGTGSGTYEGFIDGPAQQAGSTFHDSTAQTVVASLLDQNVIAGSENSLFMLILPDGVTSVMDQDGSRSCAQFCGYHDAFMHKGTSIAYAVLPSTKCSGCGGELADFTAVYAHELAEAVTDKVPGEGWVADDGEENGDLEAWDLLRWGPPEAPDRYTIQGYYTNERGNTVGAWRASSS
jgi:hypothetical protein